MNDDTRQFEERLSAMQLDLAVIRSNYVTREEAEAIKGALETNRLGLENLQKLQDRTWAAIEDLRRATEKLRDEMHREQKAVVRKMMGFVTVLIGGVHILGRFGY